MYVNTRFFQGSFSFYRVLPCVEKVLALKIQGKDIKGLKKRKD